MHLFESGNLPLFVAKLGDFISSAKRLDRQSFVWGMFFLLFAAMSIVYQNGLLSLTLSVTLSLPFFTLDDKPLLSIIRPCWKERDFPLRSLVVTRGPKWRNSRPVFFSEFESSPISFDQSIPVAKPTQDTSRCFCKFSQFLGQEWRAQFHWHPFHFSKGVRVSFATWPWSNRWSMILTS